MINLLLFLLEKTQHLFLVYLGIAILLWYLHVDVTVDGVESLLSNLDQSKAGGPDGTPARFLKEMAMDLAPSLTLIFQASLHRDVPDDWKKSTSCTDP